MSHLISATPANIERPAVIAVTSGKGGVGKTHISVNVSLMLARLGKRTMLLDADMGLANAGLLLGVKPDNGVGRVIEGEAVADAAVATRGGISLLSASDPLTEDGRERLCAAFQPMVTELDYLVIDLGAGIGEDVTTLAAAADVVTIVLADEPASFMDAYQLLKLLHVEHGCRRFAIVTSMVQDEAAGRLLFSSFARVASRFLDADLTHLGSVPRDNHVRQSAIAKRAVSEMFPEARASYAFAGVTRALDAHVARVPVQPLSAFFAGGETYVRAA